MLADVGWAVCAIVVALFVAVDFEHWRYWRRERARVKRLARVRRHQSLIAPKPWPRAPRPGADE